MPTLISVSVRNVHGYISLSKEDYLVFFKCFWYNWFVIIIFPTFGLTTFHAVFVRFLENDKLFKLSSSVKWQCFFMPETSAFFVELVSSTALVTTALELLRPVDILRYILSLSCAKTEANVWAANWKKRKFGFGENYGGNLSERYK